MKKLLVVMLILIMPLITAVSIGESNTGVIIDLPTTTSSGGGGGGNVTSVTSSTNCILVSPSVGDVVLTFNTSCGGTGGGAVDSVTAADNSLIFNPTTGNVQGSINGTWLNDTIESFNYITMIQYYTNATASFYPLNSNPSFYITINEYFTNATQEFYPLNSNPSGFLQNIVEDTTPQLGGNLDVNGNIITSAMAGDVEIVPHGAGELYLHSGISGVRIATDSNNANISLNPHGNGLVTVNGVPVCLNDSSNCPSDQDTTYTPGSNLTLTGTEFSANMNAMFSHFSAFYINKNQEANLNVNSSTYWTGRNSVNTTQFITGQILSISNSWLTSFINSFNFMPEGYYNQNLNTTETVVFNRVQAPNGFQLTTTGGAAALIPANSYFGAITASPTSGIYFNSVNPDGIEFHLAGTTKHKVFFGEPSSESMFYHGLRTTNATSTGTIPEGTYQTVKSGGVYYLYIWTGTAWKEMARA